MDLKGRSVKIKTPKEAVCFMGIKLDPDSSKTFQEVLIDVAQEKYDGSSLSITQDGKIVNGFELTVDGEVEKEEGQFLLIQVLIHLLAYYRARKKVESEYNDRTLNGKFPNATKEDPINW